jgi:hypothetical protein
MPASIPAVVLAVALAVGGPYVYINLVQGDTPDRLDAATEQAAADTTTGGASVSGSPDGTWTVGSGSTTSSRTGPWTRPPTRPRPSS